VVASNVNSFIIPGLTASREPEKEQFWSLIFQDILSLLQEHTTLYLK